jgi:hypothetical protein
LSDSTETRPKGYATRHERYNRSTATFIISVVAAFLLSSGLMMYIMWRTLVFTFWILALM